MDDRAVCAAANNAEWCDLICRSHEIPTEMQPGFWVAQRRHPELYPDVVTLSRGVVAVNALRATEGGPGCAVKDSFAVAQIIRKAVLHESSVRVLALRDATGLAAGAVANRASSVVGVSNVFTVTTSADAVWSTVADAIATVFPSLPLGGYEHGEGLDAALAGGFTTIGALRVWFAPSHPPH